MKKKIRVIGIALVLAVVLTLCFSSIALAAEPIELQAKGDSTVEWTDEEVKFDDYSVKLSMRGGWWDEPNNNAEVQISITGNPKISDIVGWSYWTLSPDKYTVPIELNLDTTGGGEIDKVLYKTVAGDTEDGWFKVDQDTGHWWYGAGSPDNWAELQSWVDSHYPDATLARVDLGYGPLGSNQAIDAYVDDFTLDFELDGIIYSLEPPPPIRVHHKAQYITIRLPDAKLKVKRCGTMWYGDVDFNDGTWRIQIPAGVRIWDDDGGSAHKLVVDENGNIISDIWYMRGEPVVTRL